MASEIASERSLAYAMPAIYSSRDFVSVHETVKPSEAGRWWSPGSTFSIALRNLSQSDFIDPSSAMLQFSVFVRVNGSNPTANPLGGIRTLTKSAASATLPGAPAFGCPFFSQVGVTVPGLGLRPLVSSAEQGARFIASRLLCSSGPGSWRHDEGRTSYQIASSRAYMAGARSAADRLAAVTCEGVNTSRAPWVSIDGDGSDPVPEVSAEEFHGVVQHYAVPLSMFSHLFNQTSGLIPLSFYASGGDLLSVSATVAPASSAVNDLAQDYPACGASDMWIIDPRVSFTRIQVNSPVVMSMLTEMFVGAASLPITPQLSVRAPMVLKMIDYEQASSYVPSVSGLFSVSIPANQPSCRGVLLRITGADVWYGGLYKSSSYASSVVGAQLQQGAKQWNGKHLLSPVPRMRNLQLRIGSLRVPLDALSDSSFTSPPAGASSAPTVNSQAYDDLQSWHEFARLYRLGRHLFNPFADSEDAQECHDAMAQFWASPIGRKWSASQMFLASPGLIVPVVTGAAPTGTGITSLVSQTRVWNSEVAVVDPQFQRVDIAHASAPNLFVFPFESFPQLFAGDARDDAFALRGLDLRNITSVTVSGEITGVQRRDTYGALVLANDPQNELQSLTSPNAEYDISTSGWIIEAALAYDRCHTILSGRIDTESQFSLVPAAAPA